MEIRHIFNLSEAARYMDIKNIGRTKIYVILRKSEIINDFNRPYPQYIDWGFLNCKSPSFMSCSLRHSVTLVVGWFGMRFLEKTIRDYLKVNPPPRIPKKGKRCNGITI